LPDDDAFSHLSACIHSQDDNKTADTEIFRIGFLEKENHAIVAWFNRGSADERKSSKYGIIRLTCRSK